MPIFQYKARTKEGAITSGEIDTTSREAAIETLQQKNLFLLSLGERSAASLTNIKFNIGSGVGQRDLVVFSRQLATLFQAHIPIVEALSTLISETSRPRLREIISEILEDITGGMALSQAMGKHPEVFSSFYVNLVRSGEESGKLQDVFSYLADYMERSHYLMTKARNAMIYPIFVMIAFTGVLFVLLTVVIPGLVDIFEETGQELPIYTQFVLWLSVFLKNWSVLLLALAAGGSLTLWRWSQTSAGRMFVHRLQLRIPILGGIYQKLYLSRMTDNLQTLIVGGIPIMRALAITSAVVGNEVYKKALEDAIESVKGGGTISAALERTPDIPPLVTQMIKIGESTGKLDFILANIAKFYQREVDSLVDNLVALIEPIMIIFLGGGVALLVAAVMVPLYNLVGSL